MWSPRRVPGWKTNVTLIVLILLIGLYLQFCFSGSKPSTSSKTSTVTETTTTAKKSEPVTQQQETRPEPEPQRPAPQTDLPSISIPIPPAMTTPTVTPEVAPAVPVTPVAMPTVTPVAPVAPVTPVTPITPVPPIVSTQELIQDLGNADIRIAHDSALRLILRDDAVPNLVEAYASGNTTMKIRTMWCLQRMGEPRRLWLNRVLANQVNWRPSLVKAVEDVLNALNGEFSPQPTNLPEVTNDQIIARISELRETLSKREAEYNQLVIDQREMSRELTEAKARVETIARRYHWDNNRQDANLVIQLKGTIKDQERAILQKTKEINSLSEQNKLLSIKIDTLKEIRSPKCLTTPSCYR